MRIGRLLNPDPAVDELNYSGTTIQWIRSGSAPEINSAQFQFSPDGTNWSDLGPGFRNATGWQITNVTLAAEGQIRGLGRVSNGNAEWLVGKVAALGTPFFVYVPGARTNETGTSASLSVNAAMMQPGTYQWLKDGVPLTNEARMSGLNGPHLIVSNVQRSDAGDYSLMLSNNAGVAISSNISLTMPNGLYCTPIVSAP